MVDSIITAVDPPKNDDVTRTVIARPGAPEASADDDRAHYLVVVEGDGPGRRFEVGGENLVVGRTKPADIVVSDALASRNHCRVGLVMGELFVTDLGSSNGTYVAGKRVNKAIVSAGERITIGKTILGTSGAATMKSWPPMRRTWISRGRSSTFARSCPRRWRRGPSAPTGCCSRRRNWAATFSATTSSTRRRSRSISSTSPATEPAPRCMRSR